MTNDKKNKSNESNPSEKEIKELLQNFKSGQFELANKLAKSLTEKYPSHQFGWKVLGSLLSLAGKFGEAVRPSQKAVDLLPLDSEAHYNLATNLSKLGQLEKAEKSYKKAIELKPDYFEAYNNLGITLWHLEKYHDAELIYKKINKLNPRYFKAYSDLGTILYKQSKFDEAEQHYKKAIELKPDYFVAYSKLGNTLCELSKFDEAEQYYKKAIELRADYFEAHNNLGTVYQKLGKLYQAEKSYKHAIKLKKNNPEPYYNLGNIFLELGQIKEAIKLYDNSLLINSNYELAKSIKLYQHAKICDWDTIKNNQEAIKKLGTSEIGINPLNFFSLDDSPEKHYLRSKIYTQKNFLQKKTIFLKTEMPSKSLKIGYFGSDFCDHPVMHLLMQVLKLHDRKKFKIYAYSYGPEKKGDEIQKKVISRVDVFHNVHNLSNNQILKLCLKDQIDIAVDLNGFTKNNRFSLFASGLAPVQISFLGYPGTTASKFMDYLIADKVVIPNDKKKHYSENLIYLPYCYLPADSNRIISSKKFKKSEMNLPDNGFIFCCFNNSYKISEVEYDIWMRLLKNVEGSVLWLSEANLWAKENLKKEAKKRGIEADRIIFAKKEKKNSDHLSRLGLADLFLDTFNYNAHTTASDALWAGLPILTKIGKSFSARVASSLLYAMDLSELVTNNLNDYEKLALSLAKNPKKLLNIKNKILLNQKKSPLFDSNRYTKYLESGYLQAYKNYYKDNKHKTIHISDDFYN